MNFTEFFKNFENRNNKISELQKSLDIDYKNFVNENRKEIKKSIPKNGTIVKYTGERKTTYEGEEWKYLKITDNRLIAKPEYRGYIPKIGVIPLDKDFKELRSYSERIAINLFEIIDKKEQTKASSIGYVYILNVTDTNIYKIGYSKNANKRIDSIKTSSPLEIELLKVYKCYNALQVEKELHNLFKPNRTNREWFKLNSNDLDILQNFVSDFFIDEYEEFPDEKKVDNNDLPLESFEIEKEDIKERFKSLINNYIENSKQCSIGDIATDSYGQKFIIENISLWDKLESNDKKIFLNYSGYQILKSGKKSKKYSPFIFLKDRDNDKTSHNEKYFQEKKKLLKEYQKLKSNFSKNYREFKKGDKVIDIFEEEYIIDEIDFNDSLEWKNKAYFTYGGKKILANGQLSKKFSHLHRVKKA